MAWKIVLSDIDLGEEEIEAVTGVLRSKWLSMGPVTRQFEEEFARYLGADQALALANGTAALHIACLALGIGPADEVIVPSLTFVATANAVLYCGATPVFADITSRDNFNISPEDILRKITGKTKAIITVHYGGYPCDMEAITRIAADHGLKIIEDAAHAPGAEYRGRKLGTIGDIGCFSFFANKNMAAAEGGMIVTNDPLLAEKIRIIRSHGMTALTWDRHRGHAYSYDVVELGYNYRINEIASALGLVQLKKLDRNNEKRKRLTEKYRQGLKNIPSISLPLQDCREKPSFHIFPVILPAAMARERFMEELKKRGIQTSIHYPPVHLFSFYQKAFGLKEGMLPKTEFVGRHVLTLPLHPLLEEKDVEFVTSQLTSLLPT